ncbi:MAG: PAS domain S-box protein [Microcoleus sp. SM1_3_4]|nr:PAS domain S-box protein [Microcoleus sp. SM1_3_4]
MVVLFSRFFGRTSFKLDWGMKKDKHKPINNFQPSQEWDNVSVGFLSQVLNSLRDPILVKDRQHRWVLLNDAACTLIGRSREELIGKSGYDFFPETLANTCWEKDEVVFTSGVTDDREEFIADANGVTHIVLTKKSLFEDEVGNKFLVCVITDATEKNRTEEVLSESEVKLRKISANVPGMLYHFVKYPDGSMTFPYVSWGSNELCGLAPEAIQAEPDLILSTIHPEERDDFNQSVAVSAETLQPWSWEGRFILASGEIKWLQGESRPEQQADGSINWYGVLIDVTRRKQVEEELAIACASMSKRIDERTKEHARLVAILEATSDYVAISNADGYFTYMNNAGRRMLGIGHDEDISKIHFTQTVPQQILQTLAEEMKKLYSEGIWMGESVLLHTESVEIPVSQVIMASQIN